MQKSTPPPNADAYVAALSGWHRPVVENLRRAASTPRGVEEVVKWGNLVYLSNGPILMIRAEAQRVLFGFWRGQRLRDLEPRLKRGGKYEMATLELKEGDTISQAAARRLVKEAITLNESLGDPTRITGPKPSKKRATKRKR